MDTLIVWALLVMGGCWHWRQQDSAKIIGGSVGWYSFLLLNHHSALLSAVVATILGMVLIVSVYLFKEVQATIAKVIITFLVVMMFAMGGVVDVVGQELALSREASALTVWVLVSVLVPLVGTALLIHLRDPLGVG